MNVQSIFGISVVFGLVASSTFGALYLWPWLHGRSRVDALRPLLVIHAFRYIGLSFLVPGVVAPDLPMTFARSAAWGDLAAAVLALLALATLRSKLGIAFAWAFNLWGAFDLLDAFYQAGMSGLSPSQFGAAFFIPTVGVPLLLMTHVLMFRLLVRREPMREARGVAMRAL
ncbi:MAG: hypothetical protein JSS14_21515 [Proteobacteria bacterium]|nr:hypothetical protein [Pseudomonadota bacterium]